jgi:hypothetical protein
VRNVLNYQTSEYDCGPTTLINALRYLFDREQIAPELLKNISLYTLDTYNEMGETGKKGTSPWAMKFLSNWLNHYGESNQFPIVTQFLEGDRVYIGQNSPIVGCLQQKGVAVVRVWLDGEGHYVLLVDINEDWVGIFDPYYKERLPEHPDIIVIEGQPTRKNRKIKAQRMNRQDTVSYALGKIEQREAMLLYNSTTRTTPDSTIEYVI